ncbi:MAG: helix-turn-helix domain-containing protein [Desulfobacteraceae bacterium]|nr:helix-turn-helix domain-containing protein [Desulfobacteraceae bacterium]
MDEKIISENLKKLRTQKKLTLQELAEKTGLTKGYLSKVERSQKAPPYSTLTKIASALDIEVTSILSKNVQPLDDVRICLSRGDKRRIILETEQFPGYDYEVLAEGKPGKNMEPFIIHAPFEINRTYTHEGEEFIYVMDGQLEFHYGDEIYILNPGDNIYFDSIVPHVGKSLGDKKARLMVVIYFYKRNRQ